MNLNRIAAGALGCALIAGPGTASAQEGYPGKVIRIVAPATGGGDRKSVV